MIADSELALITAAELDAAADHAVITDASAGSAGTKRMLLSQWVVWIKSVLGGAAVLNVGTSAGTVAAGDDSRMTNARTPTAHASSHASGGSDPVKIDDLAAGDDNTDLDSNASRHGLLPKLSGNATDVLRGDGTFGAAPSLAAVWPVGSIFLSVSPTNPGTSLGFGTWVAFGAGRMMVGFSSGDADFDPVENTGGAKTITLTEAQLASHDHGVTDAGHTHAITDTPHSHTTPDHTHVLTDPGHSHGVTDPGHTHASDQADTQALVTAGGGNIDVPAAGNTGSSTTGLTVNSNTTGITMATDGAGTTSSVDLAISAASATADVVVDPAGGGQAHDNLPPFIVVHMWKRTA